MADDLFTAHMSAGAHAAAGKDWATAERHFHAAVTADPSSAVAHRNLSAVLQSLGRLDEAEAACRKSIDLDPESAGAHFNLGSILLAKKDFAAGEAILHKALSINPGHAEAAYNLGRVALLRMDGDAAFTFLKQTLAADPSHGAAALALAELLNSNRRFADAALVASDAIDKLRNGTPSQSIQRLALLEEAALSYKNLGDLNRAAECYREILNARPHDSVIRHLLAAVEGTNTEAHARAYAKMIFDGGAKQFTENLVEGLKYRAPEIIAGLLHRYRNDPLAFANVVDLGCGTGLVGTALVSSFKLGRLVGVDLSEKMMAEARGRGIYSELVQADLVTYLGGLSDGECDLITAADVFIYVGRLDDVFVQVGRVLSRDGLFVFCTEITNTVDVELAPTGRYRHGKPYIRRLAEESGFAVIHESDEPLRLENEQQVYAQYCVLQHR